MIPSPKTQLSLPGLFWMVLPNILWLAHALLLLARNWWSHPKWMEPLLWTVLILLPITPLTTLGSLIYVFWKATSWPIRIATLLLQILSVLYTLPWLTIALMGPINPG